MTDESQEEAGWSPDVANRLGAELDAYQDEAEERWLAPTTDDERSLHAAMKHLENHALGILTTGEVPANFGQRP